MSIRILQGDCREVMGALDAESIDAIVCDPPYELGFMGKGWDRTGVANDVETWRAALRVLKPGGHLLAFSGTRTYHRMVCAIEDAGFEIRDQIGWLYGSGFPKSLDVSKAIDKAAGAEREIIGKRQFANGTFAGDGAVMGQHGTYGAAAGCPLMTAPATDAARQWQGWGTALKPAYEPVVMAQKPYTPQQLIATLVPTIRELLCKVDSLAETDTSLSELLQALGFWSTGSLLNECLDGLSQTASRFTTETAFAMTTDLRTLKFSLSRLMRAIITGDTSPTSGAASSALDAAAISRSVQAKCERLSATTAGEIAIDWSADEDSDPEESRLSPNWRSIVVARKPLIGTVAANVLAHGTGGLNIDGCRVNAPDGVPLFSSRGEARSVALGDGLNGSNRTGEVGAGRWPANVIHDGSEEVLAAFPETESGKPAGIKAGNNNKVFGQLAGGIPVTGFGDKGSAARFFYTAKASAHDRNDGTYDMPRVVTTDGREKSIDNPYLRGETKRGNHHPTVKPTDLMRYLCRLVTPPGGIVLDPFMGSGSTLKAAELEGFDAIGIELDVAYIEIAKRRIASDAPLFAEVAA